VISRTRRRLLIWGLSALLVVALCVVGGAVWWRWDTDRQPVVQDSIATMSSAVAAVVVAAGPAAAVAISAVVPSTSCKINLLSTGSEFTAAADLYTDPGTEDALITTIAQRLPAGYAARRGPAISGVRPLEADVAGGVLLSVRKVSVGWLTITARTGCSRGTASGPATPPAGSPGTAAITAVFATLGTTAASFAQTSAPCSTGRLITVSALSEAADSSHLTDRLLSSVPTTAHVFSASGSNRLAYRDGTVSVVIAASDDGSTITAQRTTDC
jgi:hypothetical protein